MPSTPHKVTNISTASFTLDGVDYSDAVTSVVLTSTSTDTTWTPISGNTQTTIGVPVWTCVLEFGQDLSANTTLNAKLIDLHGQTKEIVFSPTGTITQEITINVTVKAPSSIGGGVGVATSSSEMPVNGQPAVTYGV